MTPFGSVQCAIDGVPNGDAVALDVGWRVDVTLTADVPAGD